MRVTSIFLLAIFLYSPISYSGCMEPFGTYVPKSGDTKFVIEESQHVKMYNLGTLIYEGDFANFDELKGTEFHAYENVIVAKPRNAKQSYIAFHISHDCKMFKAFAHFWYLEKYGGTPPTFDATVYWKND